MITHTEAAAGSEARDIIRLADEIAAERGERNFEYDQSFTAFSYLMHIYGKDGAPVLQRRFPIYWTVTHDRQ